MFRIFTILCLDGGKIMNKIYIFNETDCDLKKEIRTIKRILRYGTKKESLKNVEFNVIFVDDAKIHEINRDYRGIDRVTDVITFALEDNLDVVLEKRILGDIYISVDKAKVQAVEYGHSFLRELCFLAVHGFYHLLGYDHMNTEDEKIMFEKQEMLLDEFNIKRSE